MLTHNWRHGEQLVEQADTQLAVRVRRMLKRAAETLLSLRRHEAFRKPVDAIVRTRQQRVDDHHKGLKLAMHLRLQAARERIARLDYRLQLHRPTALLAGLRSRIDAAAARLAERHPRHLLRQKSDQLTELNRRLGTAMRANLSAKTVKLDALTRELDAIGPLQVLKRGYSITMRRRDRQIVKSVKEIQPGDRLVTRFADGEQEWTASDGQMKLFP